MFGMKQTVTKASIAFVLAGIITNAKPKCKSPFRMKLMRALIISTAAIITVWPSNLNAVVSPCASGTAIDFEVALAKRRNSFSITFLGGRMQHDATWQGFELPSELVITYSALSNFRCTRATKCKTFNFGAFKTCRDAPPEYRTVAFFNPLLSRILKMVRILAL